MTTTQNWTWTVNLLLVLCVTCIQSLVLGQILLFGRFIPVIENGYFAPQNISMTWEEIGAFQYGIFISCGPFIYSACYFISYFTSPTSKNINCCSVPLNMPIVRCIFLWVGTALWVSGTWVLQSDTTTKQLYMDTSLGLIPLGGSILYWMGFLYVFKKDVMDMLWFNSPLFLVFVGPYIYLAAFSSVVVTTSTLQAVAITSTVVIIVCVWLITVCEILVACGVVRIDQHYELPSEQVKDIKIENIPNEQTKKELLYKFYQMRMMCMIMFGCSVLTYQFLFIAPFVYLPELMKYDSVSSSNIAQNMLYISALGIVGVFVGVITSKNMSLRRLGHIGSSGVLCVIFCLWYRNMIYYSLFCIFFGIFSGWDYSIIYCTVGRYLGAVESMIVITVASIPSAFTLHFIFNSHCIAGDGKQCLLLALAVISACHVFCTVIYCCMDFAFFEKDMHFLVDAHWFEEREKKEMDGIKE